MKVTMQNFEEIIAAIDRELYNEILYDEDDQIIYYDLNVQAVYEARIRIKEIQAKKETTLLAPALETLEQTLINANAMGRLNIKIADDAEIGETARQPQNFFVPFANEKRSALKKKVTFSEDVAVKKIAVDARERWRIMGEKRTHPIDKLAPESEEAPRYRGRTTESIKKTFFEPHFSLEETRIIEDYLGDHVILQSILLELKNWPQINFIKEEGVDNFPIQFIENDYTALLSYLHEKNIYAAQFYFISDLNKTKNIVIYFTEDEMKKINNLAKERKKSVPRL